MALAITNRGTGTHNSAATSFTLSPASNFAAGSTAVLCVAADNSSSAGTTNDFTTVTDSIGNTWTKRQSPVFDNGAASAGVQGAVYDCEQDVGTLQTGTVITVNFGSSPVAKTWTLTQIAPGAGNVARFRAGGDKSAGASSTAPTLTTASVNVGEVCIAAHFLEAGTTETCTGDSDTTNGTWTALQFPKIGTTTSGSCCTSQAKLQTTTASAQTYNVSLGISADYHSSYAIYQEVVAATNVTPTAASVTASGASPTITLGTLGVAPTAASVTLVAAAPTITFGSVNVTPIAAVTSLLAAAPVVESGGGAQNITPTAAAAAMGGATPTVTLGALSVTPTPAVLAVTGAAPTRTFGALSVTPTAASLQPRAATPAVQFGALGVTPVAALLSLAGAAPSKTFGAITVTPSSAVISMTAPSIGISLGALGVVPSPAVLTLIAAGWESQDNEAPPSTIRCWTRAERAWLSRRRRR